MFRRVCNTCDHDPIRMNPFGNAFAAGLVSGLLEDYLNPAPLRAVIRPRRQASVQSLVGSEGNQFQVMLNVQQFRPDEIEIKIVDSFIVIHGKHEEQADQHGFVSREFTRRYQLPDDVETGLIKSSLSQDGVLTIRAPRKQSAAQPKNERIVPITMQQPAAVEEAQKQQEEKESRKAAEEKSEG